MPENRKTMDVISQVHSHDKKPQYPWEERDNRSAEIPTVPGYSSVL